VNKKQSEFIKFLKKLGIIPTNANEQRIVIDIEGVPMSTAETHNFKEVKCKHCGTSLSQCKSSGFLNCDVCYETFSPNVLDNLKRINGDKIETKTEEIKHVRSVEDHISNLNFLMNSAVQKENYEEAVLFRDKIKKCTETLVEIENLRKVLILNIKNDNFDEAKSTQIKLEDLTKNLPII
jgi:protein-arginine kinase activator protein McsA